MKVIHCADIHLDSKLSANLSKNNSKERKREILSTFSRMIEYARNKGIEAILIAGDLFDTKLSSALSRNTIKQAIENNPDILFFYLRGNHDENAVFSSFEEMPDNLFMFSDSWQSYALGDSDRVVLHGVELNHDNSLNVQMNFAPDPSKINIVMLHGQESEASNQDKTEVINLKLFRNKGIDYMALGHVHAVKVCELDKRGKYVYCGCLEGRGFDELGDHGFFVLDINEEKGTVTEEFVPFAFRRLYQVDVDVTGLNSSAEMIERVDKELKASPAKEIDLVKVVLTGQVDVECEKDPDFIWHTFEGNYYYMKVYDKTSLAVDPESFALDTSLKGEFVRTVLECADLSDEDKGDIVRLGLNVLMGGKPEL